MFKTKAVIFLRHIVTMNVGNVHHLLQHTLSDAW